MRTLIGIFQLQQIVNQLVNLPFIEPVMRLDCRFAGHRIENLLDGSIPVEVFLLQRGNGLAESSLGQHIDVA